MESSNKTIAKNTAFLYVRMLVVMVITFYTSRIILQVLGASDFGIYNVVGGVIAIMGFLNSSLGSSSSRFLTYALGEGNKEEIKKTFSASLNLHICVAILVLILGETIGLWFLYEKMVIPEDRLNAAFWVFQFSVITTMINFTQVPYNASLIAHENMSIYAYVGLYEVSAKLAIAYLITISQTDRLVFYSLLLMLNSGAIQLFYRFYTSFRYEECHFRPVKDRQLYMKLLNYSGWELFGGVAVVTQGQGINILLNLFFGPVVNAARAIAVQIQTAVTMFIQNFLTAVRPQVVKSMAEGKTSRMYSLTFYAAKFAYLLMLALVMPLCFEINFVLKIWLGDNVHVNTNTFAVIVLISNLMETYHLASLMPYHAIGKVNVGNIVGGSLMISSLPIAYILLKQGFPAYSAFLSVFTVNFVQMFFGWWLLHHYVTYSYRDLLMKVYYPTVTITVIGLILPFVLVSVMEEGWLRLIVLVVLTEIVLLNLSYHIGLSKDEQIKIKSVISGKLRNLR